MPHNALYVEGSLLDGFLRGELHLEKVKSNKVLVAVNKPTKPETINAVNAARATIGLRAEIVELETPLIMKGWVREGVAEGTFSGVKELVEQVRPMNFDALAIASEIEVLQETALKYFRGEEQINPWGGIEAIVSKLIAEVLMKPVAHAPIENEDTKEDDELFNILYNEVVDPRRAAEVCSNCYVHSVLRGLHTAPRIKTKHQIVEGDRVLRSSVACLVSPDGCIGPPHNACFKAGIPVIAVKENKTSYKMYNSNNIIYVENYLEAAGLVNCIMAGIDPKSVRYEA
jgi:hypothetical protein